MTKDIVSIQRNVHVIPLEKEQEFLLLSDLHWDNPKCDQVLLTRHLEEAKNKNAMIIINGDALCLMQGKFDPRGSKKDVRPEHSTGNYLDLVISTFVDFLTPYAHLIAVIGYGNHETNIIKRLETDPLQRVVDLLNSKCKSNIHTGGYGGWIVFKYEHSGARNSYRMKYYHGSGGGGPVTKNTIGHQRLDAMIDSADCIWVGHTHDSWDMTVRKETLSQNYTTKQMDVLHIQSASYKDEYADGGSGWHVERGAPPKPIGGYWLTLDPQVITVAEKGKKYLKIHARAVRTDYR